MAQRQFLVGDPAPWFTCRTGSNAQFHFDTVAGRYVVLTFFGSAANPAAADVLKHVTTSLRPHFDDARLAFFGVGIDPQDESAARIADMLPGIRYFFDFDRKVSEIYGAVDAAEGEGEIAFKPFTLVLDPFLRVIGVFPLTDPVSHNEWLGELLGKLPPVDRHAATDICAPILVLPRVFEPQFCKDLIQLYERQGGNESGFMREKDGKTIEIKDQSFKRRKDLNLDDSADHEQIRAAVRARFVRRIVPEIKKAYQFEVTRIERYVVACYEGTVGGFFRAHRDNTTKGTAHRRFACTVNLNAEDYEGGDLRFPEFGSRTYRAPTGGAVVFSCSLLHEATPVTEGKRYAFLPFLYDDAAAKIREDNLKYLSGETIVVTTTQKGVVV
jgi:peroxiredoxin/predicted 2-oxoglutarate/Fe(II)-dependent dioxygenase YbiX